MESFMGKRDQDRERRRQQRLERLGTNNPRCPGCGEMDWRCFALHHIAGQHFEETMTPLCHNCHAKVGDDQKDHPKQVSTPPNRLEQVGQFLHGLADLLALAVSKLREFGDYLIEEARTVARKVAPRSRRVKHAR
jgi:hypothetical protein